MENITFRQYQEKDFATIAQMFEDFIDYIAALDSYHRVVKQPGYGQKYLTKTLEEISEKQGQFLIAEKDNNILGYGVAIINELSQDDLLEVLPHIPGRVTELYVDAKYRGQGIGSQIMEQLEKYLKSKNCQSVHIEVFAPNIKTHDLYQKLGYVDRNVDMIKLL